MPKRRMTARRAAQIRRFQAAGVKARKGKVLVLAKKPTGTKAKVIIPRYRYETKGELPHIEYHSKRSGPYTLLSATSYGRRRKMIGYSQGSKYKGNTEITDVWKTPYRHSHGQTSAGVEPGASLLTAMARMSPKRKGFTVKGAIQVAKPFYEIMGGKPKENNASGGTDYFYGPAARKRLAGRRIVRVRSESPYKTKQGAANRRKYIQRKRAGGYRPGRLR